MIVSARPTTTVFVFAECDPADDVREHAAAIISELAQLADLESHSFRHVEMIKVEINIVLIFRDDVRSLFDQDTIQTHFAESYDVNIRAVRAHESATFDATI